MTLQDARAEGTGAGEYEKAVPQQARHSRASTKRLSMDLQLAAVLVGVQIQPKTQTVTTGLSSPRLPIAGTRAEFHIGHLHQSLSAVRLAAAGPLPPAVPTTGSYLVFTAPDGNQAFRNVDHTQTSQAIAFAAQFNRASVKLAAEDAAATS